jgi:hemerythrin
MFLLISGSNDQEKLRNIFNQLTKYTKSHFENEEKIMRNAKFPLLERHVSIHQELLAQVDAQRKKIENGEDIVISLYHFLRRWLTNHILEEDMKYKNYISE